MNNSASNVRTIEAAYGEIGDYVVPRYSEMGKKLGESKFIGTEEEIKQKTMAIIKSALSHGAKGSIMKPAPQPKKGRKINKTKGSKDNPKYVELAEPLETIPSYQPLINQDNSVYQPKRGLSTNKSINVTFENTFGRIKVSVNAILEETLSVILVFEDEEAMTFVPNQGDILTLVVNKDTKLKVMYTGFIFTWLDNEKKLMVFVKAPEEKDQNEQAD